MDESDDRGLEQRQAELERLAQTLDILDRVAAGTTTAEDAEFLAMKLGVQIYREAA